MNTEMRGLIPDPSAFLSADNSNENLQITVNNGCMQNNSVYHNGESTFNMLGGIEPVLEGEANDYFHTSIRAESGGVVEEVDFTNPGQPDFIVNVVESTLTVTQNVTIEANFSNGYFANRTIEIRLVQGLALAGAPGMVPNRPAAQRPDNWSFDPSTLTGLLAEIISSGQWIPDDIIEQRNSDGELINSYQPRSGMLVYTLYPTAPSVSFSISVLQDGAFVLYAADFATNERVHPSPNVAALVGEPISPYAISVTIIEPGAPTRFSGLERYVMTGNMWIRIMRSTTPQYRDPGMGAPYSEWASNINLAAAIEGQILNETLSFQVRVPRSLTAYEDLVIEHIGNTSITSDMVEWDVYEEASGNFLITVTLKNANITSRNQNFLQIRGLIPADTPPTAPGTSIASTPMVPSRSNTAPIPVNEGWNVSTISTYGTSPVRVNSPFHNALTLAQIPGSGTWSGAPSVWPLAPLGSVAITNPFTQPLTNQALEISFPENSLRRIGVRGFRLPAGDDGIRNVVATTVFLQTDENGDIYIGPDGLAVIDSTPGRTLPVRGAGVPLAITHIIQNFPAVAVNYHGELAANEFIATLYYELNGPVRAGAGVGSTFLNPGSSSPFLYLGRILNPAGIPGGTQVEVDIVAGRLYDPENYPGVIHPSIRNEIIGRMTTSDVRGFTFTTPTSGISNQRINAGDTLTNVSVTFNRLPNQRNATVFSVQGFYVYLRQPAGLIEIPRDSISATWMGQTFSEANGNLNIIQIVDSTGSMVWRLELPEVVLGHFGANGSASNFVNNNTNAPPLVVHLNVHALPQAPTRRVMLQDLFFISTMRGDITIATSGEGRTLTNDFYIPTPPGEVDRTLPGQVVGRPGTSFFFDIDGVALSTPSWLEARNIDANGAPIGDWVDSILNLNTSGNMEYRLTIENVSGTVSDGMIALLPIPKAGEWVVSAEDATNSGVQNTPFGFSMNLTGPAIVPPGFTVLYSVNYALSVSSPGFVPWADVAANPSAIRMVMIVADQPIPSSSEVSFILPLATLPDPADMIEYAGEVNAFSALVWSSIDGSAVYIPSLPVAVRMWNVVAYYANGGIGGYVDIAQNGSQYLIFAPEAVSISRNGYTFMGWNTAPDGSGTPYYPGQQITITGNFALYAQWQAIPPNYYNITYNANGGVGGYVDIVQYGTQYAILTPAAVGVSREGYTFMGWNTAADGSGTTYDVGQQITITGGLTLYAQWQVIPPNYYQVAYNANGGVGSYIDTVQYDTQYTILAPDAVGISREGYTFVGWTTVADGSGTAYDPGEVETITGDLALYAQWQAIPPNYYEVTYNANGGVGSYIDTVQYGTQYALLTPTEAGISREGYIFTGWNTVADGSGTAYYPGQLVTITGNLRLYAQWGAVLPGYYEVTYNANGGVGGYVDIVQYGMQYLIHMPAAVGISYGDYIFTGWNTAADGSGTAYYGGQLVNITGGLILYAQWQAALTPPTNPCQPCCCCKLWCSCRPKCGCNSGSGVCASRISKVSALKDKFVAAVFIPGAKPIVSAKVSKSSGIMRHQAICHNIKTT